MAEIYALFSARDGLVRYVGKTVGGRHSRFEQHKRTQIGRFVTRVTEWTHAEWKQGFPVESALLERCSSNICDIAEQRWMNRFPNLLNERSYFYTGERPPVIEEIKIYRRNNKPNSDGFRGIFWWGGISSYSVFTPLGTWLLGDALPGGGGSIYFSDLTGALTQRERYRRCHPHISWMPDLEVCADDEFQLALLPNQQERI